MWAQIDPQRALIVLVLLGAGMFLPALLVRPGPLGSQPLSNQPPDGERRRRQRRGWALHGMWGMTLTGLCSGLAGGLLERASGQSAPALLLHAIFRVCWAPAYLVRGLQERLSALGVTALDSELPGLVGMMLIPVFWFFAFLTAARWFVRSQ